MEKTKEQKLASIDRFNNQKEKALKKLSDAKDLYEYIDAVKYAYSFCMRYKKNLQDFILFEGQTYINPFKEVIKGGEAKTPLDKCLKAGILKPWNGTYWFDKEKAESLQQYILENNN